MTSATLRIYVVDDDESARMGLRRLLRSSGFQVEIFGSAQEFLDHGPVEEGGLIILDVRMPEMDGFETCRRLNVCEKTKEIPVIFMTALADTVDKVRGFDLGGVDYLAKPMQHEEVLARINAHLTIRQLQQQLQEQNRVRQHALEQLEEDIEKPEILHDVLRGLAAEVAATARRENLAASVVTLKIRFSGFETHSRQHKLSGSTHDERVILREVWELFLHSKLPHKPVRLIGVGISDWQETKSVQAELFVQSGKREKDDRLLQTLDRVSDRFGKGILHLGCTLKTDKRSP